MDLTRKQKLQDAMKRGIIGGHDIFTPYDLIDDVMLNMDVDLDNKNIAVLYNIEWVISLLEDWEVDPKNITFFGASENKEKLTLRFGCKYYDVSDTKKFFEEDIDMKFDVIVGNPPYQEDSTKKTSKLKLYAKISKKVIKMLSKEGVIALVTPNSILNNRQFSLTKQSHLKEIDYTVNKYFDVGVNIIGWIIDKKHRSNNVKIINSDQTIEYRKDTSLLVDNKYILPSTLFNRIKQTSYDDSLFENNRAVELNSSLVPNEKYKFPYLVNVNKSAIKYSSNKPVAYKRKKLIISSSRMYTSNNYVISDIDVGALHGIIDIEDFNNVQIQNLINFLYNPLVISMTLKYKKLINSGFNIIMLHFPKIDVNKNYTRKDIIELFNLTDDEVKFLEETD